MVFCDFDYLECVEMVNVSAVSQVWIELLGLYMYNYLCYGHERIGDGFNY